MINIFKNQQPFAKNDQKALAKNENISKIKICNFLRLDPVGAILKKTAISFKENALRPNVFHGGGDLEENGHFLNGKRVAAECFSFARLRYDFI